MKFSFKLLTFWSLLVIVTAQFGSVFEFYELTPNGNLKPIPDPTMQVTTQRYQNNLFLNMRDQNSQNKNDMKFDGMMVIVELNNCDSYWKIQNDFISGSYGVLSIPPTDTSKSVLRVVLSLASRLPSVR